MQTNTAICRRFVALVESLSLDTDAYHAILHPEFTARELPNALVPKGQVRGFDESMAGLARATQLLERQSYDVFASAESGDRVYLEMRWTGALKNGKTFTAHIAQAYELRDGRIIALRTYDCYEPFT
jgi:ketosteroid isomerase-like protein